MNRVLFKHIDGDCSEVFESLIAEVENNTIIEFEKYDYYFSKKVFIKDKENLVIDGNGACVVSEFDAVCHEKYTGIFGFENCNNIKLLNMNFDTSEPVNPGGKIVAVDIEKGTFDVELYPGHNISGSQRIIGMNSMDSNGTPDDIIAVTHAVGIKYEMLNENNIRIFYKPIANKSIIIGDQICLRHAFGGFFRLDNGTVTFRNCTDIVLENLNVFSCVHFMFVVFPRCHNLSLENINVGAPKRQGCLMGSNVDAVHIIGLTGKLVVNNCTFSGLGDDALNIHSLAGTVVAVSNNHAKLVYRRFVRLQEDFDIDNNWCRSGDKIIVYSKDFLQKGEFVVENFENGILSFNDSSVNIEEGDILANTAYYATVQIKNCLCENSRVRAFLIQTKNVIIEKSKFFGMAFPAIIMAPDIEKWGEVGPVKDVIIKNCVFQKCGFSDSLFKRSSIVSSGCHAFDKNFRRDLHKNITIRDNEFIDTEPILLNSVEGVVIENNRFIDCKESTLEKMIILENCNKIQVVSNCLE